MRELLEATLRSMTQYGCTWKEIGVVPSLTNEEEQELAILVETRWLG